MPAWRRGGTPEPPSPRRASALLLSPALAPTRGELLRFLPQTERDRFQRVILQGKNHDAAGADARLGRNCLNIAERQLTLDAAETTQPFAGVMSAEASAPSRAAGEKPVSLTAAEAANMGSPDPDPAVTAAAERLRRRIVYRFLKRAFDIVFSAAALVCLSWLYLIVAIAIKLDDPAGPVFFVQERVGRNGKRFRMWKFRSMCSDAEAKLAALQAQNEKDGPVFKIAEDPRVTHVGRFIRKTSIDELPQFANVLLGHMSVVGPRPALPREVAAYTPRQRQRLLVKPGITCYWQTRRNRDSISFDEWVALDLLYIKKCSVWTDFKLIIQTVGVVLTAQGS